MLRNQSRERIHRVSLQANQPPIYIQSSSFASKQNVSNDTMGIQKNRTFSHKKLSITSTNTITTASTNDQIRRVPIPNFEVHKFYKQSSKNNLLTQSKKTSIQDGKVSLKLSSEQMQNFDVASPNKLNQRSRIQMNANQSNYIQNIKNDLCHFISSKCQTLMFEVNNQSHIINDLKSKIQRLENQIKSKNTVINSLISQRNYIGKANFNSLSSQQEILNRRLMDVQKTFQIMFNQSNKAQNSINQRLQHLTKELVQLTLSSNTIQKLRKSLNDSTIKLSSWLTVQEQKLNSLQHSNFTTVVNKIDEILASFRLLSYRVLKIEQQAGKKEESLRTEDTKTSIGYWQSFQDFVANADETEVQNCSTFAGDDYFFHPNNNSSILKMKSSRHSSNFTVATTLTSTDSQSSQASQSAKLIEVASHLKLNYGDKLPLHCWVDKHNRIGVLQTSKLLQSQKSKHYFKVTEQQAKWLEDKRFIILNKLA